MTEAELQQLLQPFVQRMIEEHLDEDPSAFALRCHAREDLPVRAMAEQIACRRKARVKLPSLAHPGMLFTSRALEQASSEATARWKASQLSGSRLLDLSGGLGIDTLFLSASFSQTVSAERDPVLFRIARHNAMLLGHHAIRHCNDDGLELLLSFPDNAFDWIYADPDRREGGRRHIGLDRSSPDVVAAHDLLLRKAAKVCIKASPMLDPARLRQQLPSLSSIVAVSVEGECRELLLLLDRTRSCSPYAMRRAVCLSSAGVVSFAIGLADGVGDPERRIAASVGTWFLEPDAAIIKAGLTASLAGQFGLAFVNASVDYLTSPGEVPPDGFPGRVFRVVATVPYKPKRFGAFLSAHGIAAASVQRRDFPLTADELRRKHRLKESSERFLFFTRDALGGLLCIYGLSRPAATGAVPAGQGRSGAPEC